MGNFLSLAAFSVLLSPALDQDEVKYTNYELGLEFSHPSSWKVSTKKDKTTIQIPVAGSAEPASLEILGVMWQAAPSLWEEVQRQANKQLKREIVRQWQEEILGVPLLLTKIAYEDTGGSKNALIGLLYNAAPRKFNFRLVSSADSYENAEFALRQALQSLRTVKGDMPKAEDPSRPVDPKEYEKPVQTKPLKRTIIASEQGKAQEFRKAEQSATVRVAERDVRIYFPPGWTLSGEGADAKLVHPELPSGLAFRALYVGDSDAAGTALQKSAATALDSFATVATRTESKPSPNMAGCIVSSVWRTGQGPASPAASVDAVGIQGDFYWLVTYRGAAISPKALEAIQGLLASMSIEQAP